MTQCRAGIPHFQITTDTGKYAVEELGTNFGECIRLGLKFLWFSNDRGRVSRFRTQSGVDSRKTKWFDENGDNALPLKEDSEAPAAFMWRFVCGTTWSRHFAMPQEDGMAACDAERVRTMISACRQLCCV